MKTGVVLPIYNQTEQYIIECFKSIEAQTFRDFRLVIVIDGADRATIKSVNQAVPKLTIPFEIIHHRKNQGIARSLNTGFAQLEDCQYLTWISSDNRHQPSFLEKLVAEMDNASDDVILVYSLYHIINKNGSRLSDDKEHRANLLKHMNREKETIVQNSFIGPSFLFRTDAFVKTDGYDPVFETVEDYEFWIRLLQLGEIRFIPEFLMEYRVNGKYSYTTIIPRERIQLKSARASILNRRKMGDVPLVSVILTGYNKEKYIQEAIQSVLDQTFKDFQLIVIDDASKDNTWQIINKIHDKRMIPIRLFRNRGPSGVLNLGLKYCLGKYVMEMDGDDWIEPETLEVFVSEMEKQPVQVAMAYANRQLWYQQGNQLIRGPVKLGKQYNDKYDFLKDNNVSSPRFYRKSALKKVGGWPKKISGQKLIVDDFAVMLRLIEKYRFHWVDRPLYNYRVHDTNTHINHRQKHQQQLKYLVHRALSRWGGSYRPRFVTRNGWVQKIKLESAAKISATRKNGISQIKTKRA